jgi:signal transduction histidine kinase
MTVPVIGSRVSRSVAWRLAAGVLPSVLAVGLVVGLFYYGQKGRGVPELILVLATALTLVSIVVGWVNARYFAERLARIAAATDAAPGARGPSDELDRIERAVGSLGSALSASEAERARTNAEAAARLREQATMLAGVVSDAIAQLDGVRLPLQILLESPFGELNENQEELLRDARGASDAIDVGLRRLAQVADVDRDALPVQREAVQVNDVVRSVLPLARAAAERRGARTEAVLEPGLPRVVGDRTRLAQALTLFVTDAAEGTGPDVPLVITTARDGSRALIRISPPRSQSADGASTAPLILASRLIGAQGGSATVDATEIRLQVGA